MNNTTNNTTTTPTDFSNPNWRNELLVKKIKTGSEYWSNHSLSVVYLSQAQQIMNVTPEMKAEGVSNIDEAVALAEAKCVIRVEDGEDVYSDELEPVIIVDDSVEEYWINTRFIPAVFKG